jgi:hypothetical protein
LLVIAVVLALVAAACGSGEAAPPAAPPTLGAASLPELDSRARTLDAASLASDSLAPAALEELLGEVGYLTGREREFSGKTTTFDHVVARSLVFATPEGADAYLGWLRGHGDDVLGRAAPAAVAPPAPGGVVFTLARCGTCKKELPTFLAGWRRGATVLTLLAAGSGVNPERFTALVDELDGAASA